MGDVIPMFPDLSGSTEKSFQDLVIKIARGHGWKVWHDHDSRRTEPGFPDLRFLRKPVFFMAELKTSKGKLSAAQSVVIADLRDSGQTVYLWRPENIAEIYRLLTKGNKQCKTKDPQ